METGILNLLVIMGIPITLLGILSDGLKIDGWKGTAIFITGLSMLIIRGVVYIIKSWQSIKMRDMELRERAKRIKRMDDFDENQISGI